MSTGADPRDPWLHCAAHLNARLLAPLLKFYALRFGDDELEALVGRLGTSLEVLRDPDRWFSVELFLRAIDEMAASTGRPDIAYEAGRAMAEPGMMGPERMLVAGFATPDFAYRHLQRLSGRLSRITRWEIEPLSPGRLRATVHLSDPSLDHPAFCRNRIGVLEAIPTGMGLPAAHVDHPTCVHHGAAACVYEVRWIARPPLLPLGLVGAALLLALGLALGLAGSPGGLGLTAAAALVAMGTGGRALLRQRALRDEEGAQIRGEHANVEDLLDRNARRIAELEVLQKAMEAAVGARSEEALIDAVLARLCSDRGYDRALLLRVHQDGQRLGLARGHGFGARQDELAAVDLAMEAEGRDPRLFANLLRARQPALLQVDEGFLAALKPHNQAMLRRMGANRLVAAPVLAPQVEDRAEPLGLLLVDRVEPQQPLSLRERDMVASVARVLGTAMANLRHFARAEEELLVNQKFRQYLPSNAVEAIRADPAARLRLGGQERTLAILLTDIAGFTATSACLPAAGVVDGLNAWFRITDPIIAACGGIVDKRMGDGILVVFLPTTGQDAADHPVRRAALAATRMLAALEAARPELRAAAPAFGEMRVRHAIHHGPAIVGNMGSADRMEYTVIGDAVNVCARLEELTPAGEAWLTGEAVQAAPGGLPGATWVREVQLRGREARTQVYRLGPAPA